MRAPGARRWVVRKTPPPAGGEDMCALELARVCACLEIGGVPL